MGDTQLHTGRIWPHITRAARTAGPRAAAVAYIGAGAPTLLPLRRGDLLICDASTPALLAHATNPDALATYLDRGVHVMSSPGLHTKMIVTSRTVVVGSANASDTSTRRHETAIVSTDPALIDAARTAIDEIVNLTDVDDTFLHSARRTWERGRTGPLHQPPAEPDWDNGRLWIIGIESYDPTDAELAAWNRASHRVRRAAGPAATWALDSLTVDADDPIAVGDIVVAVDDHHLHPPAIVIDGPIRTGRRHDRLFVTRHRTDHEPIDTNDATRLPAGVDLRPRQVRSPAARAAIVGLWDTTS